MVDYYTVLLDSNNCIEFYAYEGNDSSFVRVCGDWDVKPIK